MLEARIIAERSRSQIAGPLLGALGAAAATAAVAAADPFKHHVTPPCLFHLVTGWWCPFCGGTRAAWALTHGNLRLMMHTNALFPLIIVAAVWSWLAWLGRATGWWELPVPKGRALSVAVACLLVGFAILRNLPGLGALAPPAKA